MVLAQLNIKATNYLLLFSGNFMLTASKLIIRDEQASDIPAIHEITIAAFKTLVVSNQTEQFIVMALRAAKALTVSLVAELNGQVVGHIAFSPISLEEGTTGWYGLGPVSVLPDYQRQGIGKALIQAGLTRLKTYTPKGAVWWGIPSIMRNLVFRIRLSWGLKVCRQSISLP